MLLSDGEGDEPPRPGTERVLGEEHFIQPIASSKKTTTESASAGHRKSRSKAGVRTGESSRGGSRAGSEAKATLPGEAVTAATVNDPLAGGGRYAVGPSPASTQVPINCSVSAKRTPSASFDLVVCSQQ